MLKQDIEDFDYNYVQLVRRMLNAASLLCESKTSDKRDIQNSISCAEQRLNQLVEFVNENLELKAKRLANERTKQ